MFFGGGSVYVVLYSKTVTDKNCWLEGVDYINVKVFRDFEDAKNFRKAIEEVDSDESYQR